MVNFGLFIYLNNKIETSFIIFQKIGFDNDIGIININISLQLCYALR